MKVKILSAAVLAAGLMFGMGGGAPEAKAGVHVYIGVPGVYVSGYKRRHWHCHRYKIWRNGHKVWVKKCHNRRH